MKLKKTIPVEEDNLELATKKAEEIFYDNELTPEYLDARDIVFKENQFIREYAEVIAKDIFNRYGKDWTYDDIDNYIDSILKTGEMSEFIHEEVIEVLQKNYDINSKVINI